MRLVKAAWLKLFRRRPLFWWSLVLTVGIVTVIFGIIEILHLVNPVRHGVAGGLDGFRGGMIGLVLTGSVGARQNDCLLLRSTRFCWASSRS